MANWSLVIGINDYQNRLRSLKYAKKDAELMRDYFQEQKFEQVFYFADDSPPIQAPDGSSQQTKPTYSNIISFLYDFFEEPKLDVGDNFWFFFSGHGLRHQGQDYLVPSGGNPRIIEQTNISLTYLTSRLRRCGADNVILLLDACRNENDFSNKSVGWHSQKGVITIASCSPQQESYEIPELKQGSFTYALEEGLNFQGENNCATVERLYNHLRYRVPEINRIYNKPEQLPYAVVEPATKYYYILLPQQATSQDVATLREEALDAEGEGNLEEAKNLIRRVLAFSPTDRRVLKIYERIITKIATSQPNVTPSPQPTINPQLSKSSTTLANQLKTFSFQTIIVNSRGETIKEESKTASYFTEDLGNGVTLDMVSIPAGEFMMGTDDEEIKRLSQKYPKYIEAWKNFLKENNLDYNPNPFEWEAPQHRVSLQSFFMGKYLVTQAQWQAIASREDLKIKRDLKANPSYFKGDDNLPVEQVSWYDAVEFCARLTKLTGRNYRLPSEAEWEYACRAEPPLAPPSKRGEQESSLKSDPPKSPLKKDSPKSPLKRVTLYSSQSPLKRGTLYSPFYFGETITSDLANYNGHYTFAEESKGEYREKTTAVGIFPPNGFGLYDMHGNLWEWCADPFHENYKNAPQDGRVWDEYNNDNHYHYYLEHLDKLLSLDNIVVVWSDSWYNNPQGCRSANRFNVIARDGGNNLGFRVMSYFRSNS